MAAQFELNVVAQEDHTARRELSHEQTSFRIRNSLGLRSTGVQENLRTGLGVNNHVFTGVECRQVQVHVLLCQCVVIARSSTDGQPRVVFEFREVREETRVNVSTEVRTERVLVERTSGGGPPWRVRITIQGRHIHCSAWLKLSVNAVGGVTFYGVFTHNFVRKALE